MKEIIMFRCDICKRTFENRVECQTHEAGHYGISREEYMKWRSLYWNVTKFRTLCASSPAVRQQFDRVALDRVVQALCEFEKEHGLAEKVPPSDFLY